jgi:hypothetical protein
VKRFMCLAAATVAIGLIPTAAHGQSGDLNLRVHVPFPFTVENTTLAAGENEATEPAHSTLASRDQQGQAALFDYVESAHSRPADSEVTVSVYNDAQVPTDILARAEQQAASIFSRAGLDVTWLRCTHINSGVRAAACNGFDVPGHVAVRIMVHGKRDGQADAEPVFDELESHVNERSVSLRDS